MSVQYTDYDYVPTDDSEQKYTLADTLENVLNTVVNTFNSSGTALPDRQYVAFGNVPHDCEQVTVQLVQSYVGPPGDQADAPQPCNGPRSVVVQVEIVRCTPKYNPKSRSAPDPEEVNGYTRSRSVDAWLLLDAASSFEAYNSAIADVSVTDPQGGYQGVILNLTTAIG